MAGSIQLRDAVLGNELIGEKIVSHLSLEDMKMGSLAFRGLHGMIRNSQHFTNKTILRLTNCKTFKDNNDSIFDLLHLTSNSWGTVEFNTRVSLEILEFLENNPKILGNIQTLRLTREFESRSTEVSEREKLRTERLHKKIFDTCSDVVELEIHLELLMAHDFIPLLQPQLGKRIKGLTISSGHNSASNEEYSMALQNIRYFSTMTAMKLENINVSFYDGNIDNKHLKIGIANLISSKRRTLQSLDFGRLCCCDFEWIKNIKIPNLKRIDFFANEEDWSGFVKFLKNQPPLEHLSAQFWEKDECPISFLEYLQNNAKSLVMLDLCCFSLEKCIDWSFLGGSKLKEFTITRNTFKHWDEDGIHDIHATGVSFLASLPHSVTKLCFEELGYFWKSQDDVGGHDIPDSQIISVLSRFPLVTHLELSNCYGAVDDLFLQTIITKMPKLQVLNLNTTSYCTGYGLTDYGLTGIKNGEVVGVSLTALTGLTHLVIEHCRGISTDALLSSIHHPCLQSLKCLRSTNMMLGQVEQLVSQNPSLHHFQIHVEESKDAVKELEAKLRKTRYWSELRLLWVWGPVRSGFIW